MSDRETLEQFLERNAHLKPVTGELMTSVYRKQHEAFVAYLDEQVANKMAEIDELLRSRGIAP